jgi:hypothetical protein
MSKARGHNVNFFDGTLQMKHSVNGGKGHAPEAKGMALEKAEAEK